MNAFPEYRIEFPELGFGSFKAAYHLWYGDGDAVLKVVKAPAYGVGDGEDMRLPPRFDREIEAMRQVDSPRVVRVLDGPAVRDVGGQPFVWYVEPFYGGGTLEDRTGSAMPTAEAIALSDAMLEGVQALWEQAHLVHRDIKPSNVAFGSDGPVLLDLGIALHADLSPLTNAFGISPRTPRYAAPEQFDIRHAAAIDSRTDQFLVGIVLFELLTGTHPFLEGPANGYLERLRTGALNRAALELIADDCLRAVLSRLLRPNPHERFRTAGLARRALQDCAP